MEESRKETSKEGWISSVHGGEEGEVVAEEVNGTLKRKRRQVESRKGIWETEELQEAGRQKPLNTTENGEGRVEVQAEGMEGISCINAGEMKETSER